MTTPAGWYPANDSPGIERFWDGQAWTEQTRRAGGEPPPSPTGNGSYVPPAAATARKAGPSYVVLQVILKEKFLGTGSGNLTELERAINAQSAQGYRLHTITTASSGSKGLGGGDRIQATMVFERV
jgi:hypothetical protein